MCTGGNTETKAMFEKACKDALSPAEQQTLSQAIETDQRLVHTIGLSPAKVHVHVHTLLYIFIIIAVFSKLKLIIQCVIITSY